MPDHDRETGLRPRLRDAAPFEGHPATPCRKVRHPRGVPLGRYNARRPTREAPPPQPRHAPHPGASSASYGAYNHRRRQQQPRPLTVQPYGRFSASNVPKPPGTARRAESHGAPHRRCVTLPPLLSGPDLEHGFLGARGDLELWPREHHRRGVKKEGSMLGATGGCRCSVPRRSDHSERRSKLAVAHSRPASSRGRPMSRNPRAGRRW